MLSIVEWLEDIERGAAELYAAAARSFAEDPAFAAFLQRLAEEEKWHRQLIRSLPMGREGEAVDEELITLDEKTRANISRLLATGMNRLAAGEMSREAMLETIAAAEFSEWNDIFLYALHALQGSGREYQAAVAEIERHKEEITRFLAAEPGGGRFLETVQRLPAVAGKRILIVEKHRALARLLRSIVATVGEVELVESGPEGLVRLENEHFDVVISDINMLAMNSLEFYAKVIGLDPEMKDRFVFFTGAALQESMEAVGAGEVTVLAKPAMISHLRRAVTDIAHRSRVFH
jgi:two-component system cell cycle response regulator CpdR